MKTNTHVKMCEHAHRSFQVLLYKTITQVLRILSLSLIQKLRQAKNRLQDHSSSQNLVMLWSLIILIMHYCISDKDKKGCHPTCPIELFFRSKRPDFLSKATLLPSTELCTLDVTVKESSSTEYVCDLCMRVHHMSVFEWVASGGLVRGLVFKLTGSEPS